MGGTFLGTGIFDAVGRLLLPHPRVFSNRPITRPRPRAPEDGASWSQASRRALVFDRAISCGTGYLCRYGERMATLYYGASDDAIHIDDRALAHLKIVIATKLRRNESFSLSWKHPEGEPGGRSTIWVHPSIPLRFVFDEREAPQINVKWVEQLMHTANSSGGIMLVDEVLETPELEASNA